MRNPGEEPRIAGLILAGGQSRRMGRDKALLPLASRPLLQHVIDRLAPQVESLALAVERVSPSLAGFGLPQIPDPRPGHRGPLGGLLAGLRHFAVDFTWVLLAPCDSPFLPPDLGRRLLRCVSHAAAPAACVVCGGELQPQHSLWHRDLLERVEEAAVVQGQGGLRWVLRDAGVALCEWPPPERESPSPFLNVNEPAALEEARRWLERGA